MTATAQELVANVTQLASFPEVAVRINDMLADESSGAAEIGSIIETDPALSAAMLRIANSPLYSIGGGVDSIGRAVTIVGLREVRDLAFGICARKAFEGISNELITVEDFWKHSLFCASAAQSLSWKTPACGGESLFTAGLLHDIGHLVMFSQSPELSREALQLSLDETDGMSPHLSERKVFGFDHAAVGAELARQWRLPDKLRECIEFHHDPFNSNVTADAVRVIHIANSVAVLAELNGRNFHDAPAIDDRTLTALGLSPDIVMNTVAEAQESVIDLLRIFVH